MEPINRLLNIILLTCASLLILSCRDTEVAREALEKSLRGDSLLSAGAYVDAMRVYVDAFRLSEASGNDSVKVKVLEHIGTIYVFYDDFPKAVAYYEKALDEAYASGDTLSGSPAVANLIMMEKALGNKDRELHYRKLLQRYPMRDKNERDYYALYIPFLDNMEAGRDKEMQEYLRKLLNLLSSRRITDESKALLYNHMGSRYAQREMPDSALWYYHAALKEADSNDNPSSRLIIYSNICSLFQSIGETDSLELYQSLKTAASDSIFSLRRFNSAKETLDIYEATMTQKHISRLESITWYAGGALLLVGIVMIVIMIYSRKVNRARLALVRCNETLMREEEGRIARIKSLEKENQELRRDLQEQPQQGSQTAVVPEKSEKPDVEGETAKRPLLNDELRRRLETRIMEIMANKETIFNPDYNIGMLAVELGTNSRYVTEVIKGLGATNFRNFINKYRIREVCRRLADRKNYGHLTISAIAAEVGFNSDSGFLGAFKKSMGMTPAQYRKLSDKV